MSLPILFTLDIALTLLVFIVKVALLAGILELVSRRRATTSLLKCALTTAILGSAYYLFDTTPEAVITLRTYLLVSLIGTFLCTKLFDTELEHAFFSCLLFCCLSTLMDSYTQREVDGLLPDRPTIGRKLTAAIDQRARQSAHNPALPSSPGVIPALLRLSTTPGTGGMDDTLLSPLRAVQQVKAQIADANKKSAEDASIANMLSGAGTNVSGHSAEMAALHKELIEEASPGAAPSPADTSAVPPAASTANVPPAAPSPTPSPAAPPSPAVAVVPAPVTYAPHARRAATAPAAAGVTAPVRNPDKVGDISGLVSLSEAERLDWEAARQQIHVSSVVKSSKQTYIMIDGHVLVAGATHRIRYLGTEYAFRFRGVNAIGACIWEAVRQKVDGKTDFVAF